MERPTASTHHYIWKALVAAGRLECTVTPKRSLHSRLMRGRRARSAGAVRELSKLIRAHDRERSKSAIPGRVSPMILLHGSQVIGRFASKLTTPYIHISDITTRQYRAAYPASFESDAAFEKADANDRETARHALLSIYSSRWAADDAIDAYGLDPQRVGVIPWGGGMEDAVMSARPGTDRWRSPRLEMLFLGDAAHRKGLDRAAAATEELTRRGVDCRLTVIGAAEGLEVGTNVEAIGRLCQVEDFERFVRIMSRTMVLLHPARGEAYGHALVEAVGFGIPVVACRVGGIPEILGDKPPGVLLEPNCSTAEIADRLEELNSDRDRLERLGMAARKRWLDRLRWSLWVDDIVEMTERALGEGAGPAHSGGRSAALGADEVDGGRVDRDAVSAPRGANGK